MVKKNEVRFKKRKGVGYLLLNKNMETIQVSNSLKSIRNIMANKRGNNFTIAKVEGYYTK